MHNKVQAKFSKKISKKHFQKVSAAGFASSKYIQCVPKVRSSTLKVCNVTYDCTRVTNHLNKSCLFQSNKIS